MLSELLKRDAVFFDGAQGTMLMRRGLRPDERPDIMNLTAPGVVEEVQRSYREAGSDILCTNTFGANATALKRAGYTPEQVISAAVKITKRVCGDGALCALNIGPLGDFMSPAGELTFEDAYAQFREQAALGERYGADLIAIETMSDLEELRAAALAARENTRLPVFATMTFRADGMTFAGCAAEELARTAEELGLAAVGLNCSLAPDSMLKTAEKIAGATGLPLIVKPNAGLPDPETGAYSLTPEAFAEQMVKFARLGAKVLGGCCGTTPEHIRALRAALEL